MNQTEELTKPEDATKKSSTSSADSLQEVLNLTERVGSEKPNTNVIQRAIGMLTQPEKTWHEIAKEEGGLVEAFIPYSLLTQLAPALIGSVIGFGYYSAMAGMYGYGAGTMTIVSSLFGAIRSYISTVVGILVLGKVMEMLAPSYGARKSWVLSCRILIYGSTPGALMSAIWFLPFVNALAGLVGTIWSLSLIYQGYRILLKSAPARPESQN